MVIFVLIQVAFIAAVFIASVLYRNRRADRAIQARLATLDRIESEIKLQLSAGYYDPQPLVELINPKELR